MSGFLDVYFCPNVKIFWNSDYVQPKCFNKVFKCFNPQSTKLRTFEYLLVQCFGAFAFCLRPRSQNHRRLCSPHKKKEQLQEKEVARCQQTWPETLKGSGHITGDCCATPLISNPLISIAGREHCVLL